MEAHITREDEFKVINDVNEILVKVLVAQGEKGDKGDNGDISVVKVNGTEITPVAGAVDVPVPTDSHINDLIANAISGITGIDFEVVEELPATGENGTIYLILNGGSTPNIYDEYIYVNGTFEKIGTTEIDLSHYVQDTRKINNKPLSSDINLKTSDLTNDSDFVDKDYLEQQENLYKSSTDTTNSYINSEGEVISLSTWRVTDYIPVVPGSTFYYEGLFNTGVAPMSAFYDSSKQFISSFKQVQGINNITIPSGASYIRFSLNNSDINIFKYDNRSYYGKYVTKQYLEQVEDVISQNIFNKATPVLNAYIDTNTMKIVSAGNQGYSSYVKIKPNTTYTVSKRAGKTFRIGTTTNIPDIGVTINQTLANHTGTTLTITTGSNDNYLVLYCWASSNGDTGTYQEMYATVQVVEGSTAKPYTPYFKLSELANILIPYTLYENESGTSGSVTLSDYAKNYKFIEIYYRSENFIKTSLKFEVGQDVNNITLYTLQSTNNGASVFLNTRTLTVSGKSIATLATNRYSVLTITSSGISSYNNNNNIYITKVIGYK